MPIPDQARWSQRGHNHDRRYHLKEAVDEALAAKLSQAQADGLYVSRTGGTLGQALRRGPSATAWAPDAVSVDWYSHPNDAWAAAKAAGINRLRYSPATTYDVGSTPILIESHMEQEGYGHDTVITSSVAGATLLQVATPSAGADRPAIRNLRFWTSAASTGLDLRGVQKGRFEDLEVSGFTAQNVLWGGDMPTYAEASNNMWVGGKLIVVAGAAGMRFQGVNNNPGGGGSPTGNRMLILHLHAILNSAANTYAIDMIDADTVYVIGGDMGYGALAIPVRLGANAYMNKFFMGTFEDVNLSVLIDGGGWNQFDGWSFSQDQLERVRVQGTPSQYNGFEDTCVGLLDENFNFITADHRTRTPQRWVVPMTFEGAGAGWKHVGVRTRTEAHDRMAVDGRGSMSWANGTVDPITTPSAKLDATDAGAGRLKWMDGTHVKVPAHAGLEAASAALAGSVAFNTLDSKFYGCTGAAWVALH